MSSPKVIVQILLTGTQIFGRALLAAGKQAAANAKAAPQAAAGADVAGVRNATSGSATDQLTLQHRMTLDEAQLILNVKREDSIEAILKNYEHLFKANSPPPPAKDAPAAASKRANVPAHSHYVQSKVVRARERIEAEFKLATEEPASPNPPPPPPSS